VKAVKERKERNEVDENFRYAVGLTSAEFQAGGGDCRENRG
jgi:hypothetical protein